MMMTTTARRATRTLAVLLLTAPLAAGCSPPTTHHSVPRSAPSPHPTAPRPVVTSSSPSATAPPSTSSTRPPGVPDPAMVDGTNAAATARAALSTMWSVDTTTDNPATGQRDAFLRAAAYLTPAYAAQIATEQTPPISGQQWLTWSAHRAYTAAHVTQGHDDGAPADTTTVAYREFNVTTTPTGRDGWHGPTAASVVVFARLTRGNSHQAWKITSMNVS